MSDQQQDMMGQMSAQADNNNTNAFGMNNQQQGGDNNGGRGGFNNFGGRGGGRAGGDRNCFKCGQPGHFSRECPQGGGQQYGGGRGRGGAGGQQQLPPGWQLTFAPTGEPYYVDHNTRTTHWHLPAEYQQQGGNQYGGRGGRGGRGGIDGQKRKTKMCMNFENGSCAWGDKCAFAHGAHELTQTNQQEGGQQQQQQQQEGAPQQ